MFCHKSPSTHLVLTASVTLLIHALSSRLRWSIRCVTVIDEATSINIVKTTLSTHMSSRFSRVLNKCKQLKEMQTNRDATPTFDLPLTCIYLFSYHTEVDVIQLHIVTRCPCHLRLLQWTSSTSNITVSMSLCFRLQLNVSLRLIVTTPL